MIYCIAVQNKLTETRPNVMNIMLFCGIYYKKMEDKNERLNAINREFEKELMTSRQQSDLLKGSNEKKEARIRDLESDLQNEKNSFVETLEKEQQKYTVLETTSIETKAQFTKDFALLKQQCRLLNRLDRL